LVSARAVPGKTMAPQANDNTAVRIKCITFSLKKKLMDKQKGRNSSPTKVYGPLG
jgi:hypothetical protein